MLTDGIDTVHEQLSFVISWNDDTGAVHPDPPAKAVRLGAVPGFSPPGLRTMSGMEIAIPMM